MSSSSTAQDLGDNVSHMLGTSLGAFSRQLVSTYFKQEGGRVEILVVVAAADENTPHESRVDRIGAAFYPSSEV